MNGENYEVYEITPPTSKENYPIGGHYRMQVTPEGRVLSTHRFAESCSAILLPAIPDDAVSFVSTGISHDSDPTPTEIHVFASYHRAVALGVFTTMSDIQWFVDRGAIVRAQLSEEKPSE